ncbi:MAG: alpha/beta hydrolase family protein [Asticcacaulis sp.]
MAKPKPKRPQQEAIAASALPYTETEVSFKNPKAPGVTLAGTLTTPQGKGPFPTILLLASQGKQTRDEVVAGHKIFLVLRDHLTREGYAVLSYDKRGVGASTGDFAAATLNEFASDAEAAIAFLRTRPDLNQKRMGLIGHSEGGAVAPMVLTQTKGLAFAVLMAGPMVRGEELMNDQSLTMARVNGAPEASLLAIQAHEMRINAAVARSTSVEDARAKVRAILTEPGAQPTTAEELEENISWYASPWMRVFLNHEPEAYLKKVSIPLLGIFGDKDVHLGLEANTTAFIDSQKHNPKAKVIVLKGHNHLFQRASTGGPREYGKIEETLSPEFLQTLTEWLKSQ